MSTSTITSLTSLPVQERMMRFIDRYYRLNRISVGDDTSLFVREMAGMTGAEVMSVPSGSECLTWVIPPKWVVSEAYLETLEGQRLADFQWNPLYLKSYSAPFSGEVSRDELMAHVLTDETRPDAIPYDYRAQFQYGKREDWGLCLSYDVVQSLIDTRYRVHIDTEFQSGEMDLLDWTLPGEYEETIFFGAHTCHPAQVNDGIANIAVLLELFDWLKEMPSRRYTYRMILGPEYFAAAAILEHDKKVDRLAAGFFLDMLGNGSRIGFSRSYSGDSYADKAMRDALSASFDDYLETPYRGLWGNDEMFYDGPCYQIPTVGFGRDRFDSYHTDQDNLENCDFPQLEESLEVLKKVVNTFESDSVPTLTYRGPLYLSRYGLYIDPKQDRKGYQSLQEIQILADGTRSCLEIANELGISYAFVHDFMKQLERNDLAINSYKSLLKD